MESQKYTFQKYTSWHQDIEMDYNFFQMAEPLNSNSVIEQPATTTEPESIEQSDIVMKEEEIVLLLKHAENKKYSKSGPQEKSPLEALSKTHVAPEEKISNAKADDVKTFQQKVYSPLINLKNVYNEQKLIQALRHRKIFRIGFLAFVIAITILVFFLVVYVGLLLKGEYNAGDNSDLRFTLTDCTLFIYDASSFDPTPIRTSYRITRSPPPSQDSQATLENSGSSYNFTFYNQYPETACYIKMYVKPDTIINSLTINCPERCEIIQDSSLLNIVGKVEISGKTIHSNFKEINASQFTFSANQGHLQLNSIALTSSTPSTASLTNEGDIIIQSIDEFKITAATNTQAFCFNSPHTLQQPATTDCAVSGDNSTSSNKGLSSCSAVYYLCNSASCSPSKEFIVNSVNGSVYANLIPNTGSLVLGSSTAKGMIFDDGINFSPKTLTDLNTYNDDLADSSKNNPTVILNVGDWGSRSSHFSKFVVSANSAYTFIKPFWLRSFSATLLSVAKIESDGSLLPGFCPFTGAFTTSQYYQVQQLAKKLVSGASTIVSFVLDVEDKHPSNNPVPDSGIRHLSTSRNPFQDYWFSLNMLENGLYDYIDNNVSKSPAAFGAVIISLIISIYGSFIIMEVIVYALNVLFFKVRDEVNHLFSYIKMQDFKDSKKKAAPPEVKRGKPIVVRYNLATLLKNSPSIATYVDLIIHIAFRQLSNSAFYFYDALFKKVNPGDEDYDDLDPNNDYITGEELKVLYERYCFVNHYYEEKLTDPQYRKILKNKGFIIYEDQFTLNPVFMKINIKNFDDFAVNFQQDEKGDSLDLYFKNNVQVTAFEDDQIGVETFQKLYDSFCDFNRLEKIIISPSLMQERYEVPYKEVPIQVICRMEDDDIENPFRDSKQKGSKWIIDKTLIQDDIAMKLGKIENLPHERALKVLEYDLKFPMWQGRDVLIVLAHLAVNALFTIPPLVIMYLIEESYTPYSLKDPTVLIGGQEATRDPASLLYKIQNGYGWSPVIMNIVIAFWVFNIVDLVIYYIYLELPPDLAFKEKEEKEKAIPKLARQIQWLFNLTALAFIMGYLSLSGVWCILGAILNPNLFLPYATGAITFVTFVKTKYVQLKELGKNGRDIVLQYLNKLTGEVMNKVLHILSNRIEGATRFVADKSKELINGPEFQNIADKVVSIGLISEESINEIKTQVSTIDSQMIISAGAAAIANPQSIVSEVEKMSENIKKKVLDKLREECKKKEIPEQFVDLMLCIIQKDTLKMKEITEAIVLEKLVQSNIIDKEILNLALELAFPSTLARESFPKYALAVVIEKILKNKNINITAEINANDLVTLLEVGVSLQNADLDTYFAGLRSILKLKFIENKIGKGIDLNSWLEVLEKIISERPPVEFINSIMKLISSNLHVIINNEESKDASSILNLISTTITLISAISNPNDPNSSSFYNNDNLYVIVKNMLNSIPLIGNENSESAKLACLAISTLLSCVFKPATSTPEISQLYIEDLASVLGVEKSTVEFVLKLVNLIYNKEKIYNQEFKKLAEKYSIHKDITEFLRIIYSYTDHESGSIEKKRWLLIVNPVFMHTCQKLKLKHNELLGLIEFLNKQFETNYVKEFYLYLLTKLKVRTDNFVEIKAVVELLACDTDEDIVLSAIKTIGLTDHVLLLMSKKFINPKYVPEEMFEPMGIPREIVEMKRDIWQGGDHKFVEWKKKICSSLSFNESLTQEECNYYLFIFSDWKSNSYNNERIVEILTTLSNYGKFDYNKLLKNDLDSSNSNLVEFYRRILHLREIAVDNFSDKLSSLQKSEKQIKKISQDFGFEYEPLYKLLELLLTKDTDPKGFLKFVFPPSTHKMYGLDSFNGNSFYNLMMFAKRTQESRFETIGFIEEFCNKIKVNKQPIPKTLIIKYLIDPELKLTNNRLLSLSEFLFKMIPDVKIDENHLMTILSLRLAGSGFLDAGTIASSFGMKSPIVIKFLDIISCTSREERFILITSIFESSHALHTALGLFTFLNYGNYKITVPTPKGKKTQSLIEFLSSEFNVYPEVFHLLTNITSRSIDEFIQIGVPIMRRLGGNNLIDDRMVQTVFGILLGRSFDPSYLAQLLEADESVISFLNSFSRLASNNNAVVSNEVRNIEKQSHFKKILKKLDINFQEFISLIKLLTGNFDDNELDHIFSQLNINNKKSEASTVFSLCSRVDPGLTIKDLELDVQSSTALIEKFNFFGRFSADKAYTSGICRVAAGNFLALRTDPHLFSWAFPTETSSLECVRNLTMSLIGLLNSKIYYDSCTISDPNFSNQILTKLKPLINEVEDNQVIKSARYLKHDEKDNTILPDNSIKFALALLHHTLDLDPKLCLYFFLDIYSYQNSGHPELIFLIVAYFSSIPETSFDSFSCSASEIRLFKYLKTLNPKTSADDTKIKVMEENLIKIVDTKSLNYKTCMNFLQYCRKDKSGFWVDLLKDKRSFYEKVNRSLEKILKMEPRKTSDEYFTDPSLFIDRGIINKIVSKDPSDRWIVVLKTLCGYTPKNKVRIPEAEIENYLILGLIVKTRYLNEGYKIIYCQKKLLTLIERFLYLDTSYYKASKLKILRLLSLSKPLLIPIKLGHSNNELYNEEYVRLMFKYNIMNRVKDSFILKNRQDIQIELLGNALAKISGPSSKPKDEVDLLKEKLSAKFEGNFSPEDLGFDCEIEVEKYLSDIRKEFNVPDKATILEKVFYQECGLQNKSSTKANLLGFSEDDFETFNLAYQDCGSFFNLAYGETDYKKPVIDLTESLFKIHLQLTGEFTLSRNAFKNLFEPIKKCIATSNDSRVEELVWVLLSKQAILPEIGNFLGMDDYTVRLMFTHISNEIEAQILGKPIDYGRILSELGKLAYLEKETVQHLELILDVFLLKKKDALPRLVSCLIKNSSSKGTENALASLLSHFDTAKIIEYKDYGSVQRAPKLFDLIKAKDPLNFIIDEVIPKMASYKNMRMNPNISQFLFETFRLNLDSIMRFFLNAKDDSQMDIKTFVSMIAPSEAVGFSNEFELFRGLLIFSKFKFDNIRNLQKKEDISKNDIFVKIFSVLKNSGILEKFTSKNKQLESIVMGILTSDISAILESITENCDENIATALNTIVSLFEPSLAKKKISISDIVSFIKESLEKKGIVVPSSLKMISQKNLLEPIKSIKQEILAISFKKETDNIYQKIKNDILESMETKLGPLSMNFDYFIDHLLQGKFVSLFLNLIKDQDLKKIISYFLQLAVELAYTQQIGRYDKSDLNEYFNKFFSILSSKIEDPNLKKLFNFFASAIDMLTYFALADNIDRVQFKKIIYCFVKEILNLHPDEKIRNILNHFGNLFFLTNFKDIETTDINKISIEKLNFQNLYDFLLGDVIPLLLPDLSKHLPSESIKEIFNILKTFRGNYVQAVKDKQTRGKIFESLIKGSQKLKIINEDIADKIYSSFECFEALESKNYEQFIEIFIKLIPMSENARANALKIYQEGKDFLDFKDISTAINKMKGTSKSLSQDPDRWLSIISSIKEGKATNKELFKILSANSENTGINQIEFKLLANRLGVKLSDHRVSEIFAKVKEGSLNKSSFELDENQFEKAMEYLQQKNLMQALMLMGITPEMLTAILIRLIILLVLILIFIFFGISAFAFGGAFGAIVNSLFPALAGIGLGKKSDDDKEKLSKDNVEKNADKALTIIQSDIV